jgi:hypothetical protein
LVGVDDEIISSSPRLLFWRRRLTFRLCLYPHLYCVVQACAGLPEPRADHAIAIVRFARDCLCKMQSVTKDLEETLGPDTGDLSIRIGIHSGSVTAGVLRGERSRFQLFGDAMVSDGSSA